MYWATLVILVSLIGSRSSAAQELTESFDVTLVDYAGHPPLLLMEAKRQAAQLLAEAGVRTSWRMCLPASERPGGPACVGAGPNSAVVRLLNREQAKIWRIAGSTCGAALVGEAGQRARLAVVDLGCIGRLSGPKPENRARTLGHIIAHELAHLLLGRGSHAEAGLMSAQWSKAEMRALLRGELSFSPQEAVQLQEAVRTRGLSEAASTR